MCQQRHTTVHAVVSEVPKSLHIGWRGSLECPKSRGNQKTGTALAESTLFVRRSSQEHDNMAVGRLIEIDRREIAGFARKERRVRLE